MSSEQQRRAADNNSLRNMVEYSYKVAERFGDEPASKVPFELWDCLITLTEEADKYLKGEQVARLRSQLESEREGRRPESE